MLIWTYGPRLQLDMCRTCNSFAPSSRSWRTNCDEVRYSSGEATCRMPIEVTLKMRKKTFIFRAQFEFRRIQQIFIPRILAFFCKKPFSGFVLLVNCPRLSSMGSALRIFGSRMLHWNWNFMTKRIGSGEGMHRMEWEFLRTNVLELKLQ